MKYYNVFLAVILACVPITTQSMGENSIVIFSHYMTPTKLTVCRETLQQIFTQKETHWDNGDIIHVFTKPMTSIEHKNFVINVLHMTLYNYQNALLANSHNKPYHITEVDTDADMFAAIHTHTGSIGYVNYNLVLNSKIIKVCDDPECS